MASQTISLLGDGLLIYVIRVLLANSRNSLQLRPFTRGARDIVPNLLHNVESEADPSLATPYLREVIDYLETEGIVVCTEVGDLVEVWIPAPLLLVGLLFYFNFVARVEFLNGLKSR